MNKLAIAFIASVAVIGGCLIGNEVADCHSVKSGVVMDKRYTPEEFGTEVYYDVALEMPMTRSTYSPESWTITFQGVARSGKIRSRSVSVTPEIFAKYEAGQPISFE